MRYIIQINFYIVLITLNMYKKKYDNDVLCLLSTLILFILLILGYLIINFIYSTARYQIPI